MAGKNVKGFTLVEVLIVVAILGILGSLAYPQFQGYVQQAKEAAAKDNLRVLRNAIGLYAAQHDGVYPGFPFNNSIFVANILVLNQQLLTHSNSTGNTSVSRTTDYPYGPYLPKIPANPFAQDNADMIGIVQTAQNMPTQASGSTGWIYQPSTGTIKLNQPGTDSEGVSFYSY